MKNPHAQELGRLGGLAKSARKAAAAKANGLISASIRNERNRVKRSLAKPRKKANVSPY